MEFLFKEWLEGQSEIVVVQVQAGSQDYRGQKLIPGQANYGLEHIQGKGTPIEKFIAAIGPVTKSQLEHLRDRLIGHFPLPQKKAGEV